AGARISKKPFLVECVEWVQESRSAFAYVSTQPESFPWDQTQVRKTPAEKNAPPIFFQTCLEAYVLPRTALELTVAIFPLIARWNLLERIPVLGDFTLFDAEEVINGSGHATKRGFGNDQDEITFTKYQMHALVDDRLPLDGKSLQSRNQARDGVGDPGIVLNVFDSVEVAGKGLATACEKVVHVALHEGLIRISLVQIGGNCRSVDHGVSAGAAFRCGFLQVVPVLDDQAVFEAKDVEANFWSEEVVLRVSEDIVPIFKDADRIDGRIGGHVLDEGGDTCRTGSHLQVVLDILVGIDICERNRIFGLKRLQQIDDLLFTAGRHGSSGTISLFVIMDHSVLYLQASQSN